METLNLDQILGWCILFSIWCKATSSKSLCDVLWRDLKNAFHFEVDVMMKMLHVVSKENGNGPSNGPSNAMELFSWEAGERYSAMVRSLKEWEQGRALLPPHWAGVLFLRSWWNWHRFGNGKIVERVIVTEIHPSMQSRFFLLEAVKKLAMERSLKGWWHPPPSTVMELLFKWEAGATCYVVLGALCLRPIPFET